MSGTAVALAAGLTGAAAALLVAGPTTRLDRLGPGEPGGPPPSRLPSVVSLLPVGAVAVGALLVLGTGPVPLLLAGGAAVVLRRVLRARAAARDEAAERTGARQACAALSAELRAGRDPAGALEVAATAATGPFARSLLAAAAAARLGGDVAAALESGPPSAVPQVRRGLAACWTASATTGAGLAAAVDRLEEGLRGAAEARRSVEAEVAGPRATAGLLALLPVAGVLLAAGLGADPLHVLLETPVGLACLVLGLALDGLGVWWTGRLVDRALRTA